MPDHHDTAVEADEKFPPYQQLQILLLAACKTGQGTGLVDKSVVIGVQQDTTGDIYASDDFGSDRVSQYSKGNEAVAALQGGDIDCVIIDNQPAKSFVEANEGLVILDTDYAVEDYAIAIAKENTDLLEKVNTALEELIADGTVKTIIDKYISAE